ncbi:hypothetical protein AMJ96_CH02619 [Rhizobium sp. N113]|uniref:methylamine utilization protein MauJ n=1 Tax=unclassified Rhizobium TaxID=2613769 RepID=UPI0007F16754|nr:MULTISPECIES: methylamine utilization protein MauJ [unclassified Rhizobium]ANL10268.1 hypothetical protein AMJ98_CH02612 [Rhizobium sp. N1341]ANL22320.1 hypothetical protein AMJ96_CH02619 [Rhizobium sp. N113]ANM41140.1 hypothetical protein AMK03_CH02651 [Rhizobium sp. N741]
MNDPNFIGSSTENQVQIPLERLGAPGSWGYLSVEAQFDDERFAGKDRLGDKTTRTFSCKARLSENPGDLRHFNGAFSKEDGSTHLRAQTKLHITTPSMEFFLESNSSGEVSMATADIRSTEPNLAKVIFEDHLNGLLDKLSYLHQAPIFVTLMVVYDLENEIQNIYFQSPPRHSDVKVGDVIITERMMPIYSLYRESQNATTPYYKLLSLYKIMEGLLNPLRSEVVRELRKHRLDQTIPKLTVPDHPDVPKWLKKHVGKPIGVFVFDFLTNEYRNAIAHFELRDRKAMSVGNSVVRGQTSDVVLLADMCARILIENHETLLARLTAAGY